jgi:pyruvate formate lyase activating enzyme
MRGLIFSVKRYSVHDGPGIRVTFFMKGCRLSCWWCHNPEGISPCVEQVMQVRKMGEKEFQFVEDAGKYYSVEEILGIADRERIFLEHSGGGITFSGGEPMEQFDFLLTSLKNLKEKGFNTAVDTSGYAPANAFRHVMDYTDLFLYDIKHLDNERHIEYTGISNVVILKNLRLILASGKDVFIRFPVIPGINDDKEHLTRVKSFITEVNCGNLKRLDLLPFHRIGTAKYAKLKIPYRMSCTEQPGQKRMEELKGFFSDTGIKVRIGG